MSRLQTELARLFGPADHGIRVMVLELARPAEWSALSAAWRGLQVELELPAPAIAVNGSDGLQLWLALAEPVPQAQALAFLQGLQARYLGEVAPHRIRTLPAPAAGTAAGAAAPPAQVAPERWSAFVAPDLAPLFTDEPWLDHPVGDEAQAELLSRIAPASPEVFARACEQLLRSTQPAAAAAPARAPGAAGGAAPVADPRQFLLGVMNDPQVPMALRIEAAKALLPGTGPLTS